MRIVGKPLTHFVTLLLEGEAAGDGLREIAASLAPGCLAAPCEIELDQGSVLLVQHVLPACGNKGVPVVVNAYAAVGDLPDSAMEDTRRRASRILSVPKQSTSTIGDYQAAIAGCVLRLKGKPRIPKRFKPADLDRMWASHPDAPALPSPTVPPVPPCPHGGHLLRTEKAQQCFECGADGHGQGG